MGLDMYLSSVARVESLTSEEIVRVQRFLGKLTTAVLSDEESRKFALKQIKALDLDKETGIVGANQLRPSIYIEGKYSHWFSIFKQAAYWRKANHIHQWFVQNVQNGVDDCGDYPVSVEKLKELLEKCMQVLKNPLAASSVLPTQSGFFFGSTDYDEWYKSDLEATVKQLRSALKGKPESKLFFYSSSW